MSEQVGIVTFKYMLLYCLNLDNNGQSRIPETMLTLLVKVCQ